ncbi:hypothetical protein [uncultured Microscilla sp.]|uniref:hypothetical protein n=1 Tax=uncultured Microscilla sp. TaxID=432653 RepID=UPI002634AF49|nr:hypothetical protein [uncultured Microscilla sp.]
MRTKAILSLDKFAKGNHLSVDQLSTVKGGRKVMSTTVNLQGDNGNVLPGGKPVGGSPFGM